MKKVAGTILVPATFLCIASSTGNLIQFFLQDTPSILTINLCLEIKQRFLSLQPSRKRRKCKRKRIVIRINKPVIWCPAGRCNQNCVVQRSRPPVPISPFHFNLCNGIQQVSNIRRVGKYCIPIFGTNLNLTDSPFRHVFTVVFMARTNDTWVFYGVEPVTIGDRDWYPPPRAGPLPTPLPYRVLPLAKACGIVPSSDTIRSASRTCWSLTPSASIRSHAAEK